MAPSPTRSSCETWFVVEKTCASALTGIRNRIAKFLLRREVYGPKNTETWDFARCSMPSVYTKPSTRRVETPAR
jgi:hypothetical protein